MIKRLPLVLLLASILGGCTWGPFAGTALFQISGPAAPVAESIPLQPAGTLQETSLAGPDEARAAVQTPLPLERGALHHDTGVGDQYFRIDQAKALEGDKDAALRVASMFQRGSNDLPRDEQRMLQWLRHASELNNGSASYQLYLYYLARGLDRDAVRYENRALQQGYIHPPRLDARRG